MKVLNVHSRKINQPIDRVATLMQTLATDQDAIWPKEHWPAMKLAQGLQPGSSGGHGPVRYTVSKHVPGKLVEFKFRKPRGFDGVHRLEMTALSATETEVKHTIDAQLSGKGIFTWLLAVRWLHDALIEDAFDKLQNNFSANQRRTEWNWWVKLLRSKMRRA